MKSIALYLILLWALPSCTASPDTLAPFRRPTAVELRILPERVETVTRTTDEDTIADVNLYLFGRNESSVVHLYATSATLSFECLPGQYDVYILTNIHRDLGPLTRLQIETLAVDSPTASPALPMSAKSELTVASGTSTFTAPAIVVKRLVAKIAYNIVVDPSVSDIELQSVRAHNIPGLVTPFAESQTTSVPDYTAGLLAACTAADRHSDSFYMFENRQGTVASITDQRQKSAENAPKDASYLSIRATRGDKVLTYRVYLGENNTDNFDVRRNTSHTYNITIRGDNEVDTRISGYTVRVRDDLEEAAYGGYCVDDGVGKHLFVQVESNGASPALTWTADIISGDRTALTVDGQPAGAEHAVADDNGMNCYSLRYAPAVFNGSNNTLRYTVTVRDEEGFCQTFTFVRTFANMLRVNVVGGGSLSVSSALYTNDIDGGKVVLGNSCTLRATASSESKFVGWYADAACTTAVSTSASYSYTAKSRAQTLYAKFALADHTPLDAAGTANCYIAPKKLARYSFDATVMGKGDWSTNIQPKKLSGTTAKVIWETGRHDEYESVVRYALYENGRIYFATGSKYGNALIGLFDASGKCIWSWHIWAADYDPLSTAETYSSGYTFMDRNLGVLSTSMTERGLYYQWGRKDPFIYPSSPTATATPAETYNLSGYEFGVCGNIGDDLFPAENYTVEWATAHPTTLLTRPFKGTVYLDSWLHTPNPNLWGNATSGSIASTKNKKSIYDPCPPGWKVPDRAAWDVATFKDCNLDLTYGANLYYGSNSSVWTFYPYTGYLSGESGVWQYRSLTSDAYVWTNEPYLDSANDSSYCVRIANGTVDLSKPLGQQFGCPVRCVRE